MSSIPVSLTTGNISVSLPIAFCTAPNAFGMDGPCYIAVQYGCLTPHSMGRHHLPAFEVMEDFAYPPFSGNYSLLPFFTLILFISFSSF